jgi:hypothetical protein
MLASAACHDDEPYTPDAELLLHPTIDVGNAEHTSAADSPPPEHRNPLSTVQVDEHPSLSARPLSSHPSPA